MIFSVFLPDCNRSISFMRVMTVFHPLLLAHLVGNHLLIFQTDALVFPYLILKHLSNASS